MVVATDVVRGGIHSDRNKQENDKGSQNYSFKMGKDNVCHQVWKVIDHVLVVPLDVLSS